MSRRIGPRLYAVLQRHFWPAAWRDRLGRPGREAFDDLLLAARREGPVAVAALWWRELRGFVGAPQDPWRRGPGRVRTAATAIRDDTRFALRQLRKRPAFAATVIVTLALGLGVATAAVAVVDAILLRPLPWARAAELVQLWTVLGPPDATDRMTVSPADWAGLRASVDGLVDLAAHNVWTPTLVEDGFAPEQVPGTLVTPNFFPLVGVVPVLGSGFPPGMSGNEAGVLLSHRLWQRRYGADPAIVGRLLRVGDRDYVVRGVLPAEYRAPEPHRRYTEPQLYAVFDTGPEFEQDRASLFLRVVGRVAPGVTIATAQSQADATMRELAVEYPDTNARRGIRLVPLREELLSGLRPIAWMILSAAGALLAIVWANVANLLFVRARQRRPEMSLRAAIGAPRRRLSQQLLVENALLALGGGAIGFAVVRAAAALLSGLAGSRLPALLDIRVDARVAAAAALLVGVSALGLSLFAAVGMPRARAGRSGASGRVTVRFRGALAAAEIAIAVALLIAATLLAQSLTRLTSRPIGFDPEGVMTVDLTIPREGYEEREPRVRLLREIGRRLAAEPAITSVGWVSDLPFTSENRSLRLAFAADPAPPEERPLVEYRSVSGSYFRAMGIELIGGRFFDDEGPDDGDYELLANQAFVDRYLADRPAIGERILIGDEGPAASIVGIVENVRDDGFAGEPEPFLYLWQYQAPNRGLVAVVKGGVDETGFASSVRRIVAEAEPFAVVGGVRSYASIVRDSLAAARMAAALSLSLAAVSLLLAALGIYGVMANLIESRTREIGVRAALGARPRDVVGQVLAHATRLAAVGAAGGVFLGWGMARGLAALLFDVAPEDPFALVLGPAVLIVVALMASWRPARRAARVSPLEALRAD